MFLKQKKCIFFRGNLIPWMLSKSIITDGSEFNVENACNDNSFVFHSIQNFASFKLVFTKWVQVAEEKKEKEIWFINLNFFFFCLAIWITNFTWITNWIEQITYTFKAREHVTEGITCAISFSRPTFLQLPDEANIKN